MTILHLSSHLVCMIQCSRSRRQLNCNERGWSKRWELKIAVVCSSCRQNRKCSNCHVVILKRTARNRWRKVSVLHAQRAFFFKFLIRGLVVTEFATKKTTRSPKICIFNIYEKCALYTRGFCFSAFCICSCRIHYVKWLVLQLRKRREFFFFSLLTSVYC